MTTVHLREIITSVRVSSATEVVPFSIFGIPTGHRRHVKPNDATEQHAWRRRSKINGTIFCTVPETPSRYGQQPVAARLRGGILTTAPWWSPRWHQTQAAEVAARRAARRWLTGVFNSWAVLCQYALAGS